MHHTNKFTYSHHGTRTLEHSKHLLQTRKQRKETKSFENFFHRIHRKYCLSHQVDEASLNAKRTVFISINGLYQTWEECPPLSLYDAIFILPLRQEWIQSPRKYPHHQYFDLLQDEQFLTLLRWKAHQHLALFLMDAYPSIRVVSKEDKAEGLDLVAPVWTTLSYQLQQLSDPAKPANSKYNALHFRATYWKYHSSVSRKPQRIGVLEPSVNDVLLELYAVSMKFRSMRKILVESNPTLNVIISYCVSNRISEKKLVSLPDEKDEQDERNQKYENEEQEPALTLADVSSMCLSRSDVYSPTYSSAVHVCYDEETHQNMQVDMNENATEHPQSDQIEVEFQAEEDAMCTLDDDWWIADEYDDDSDDHTNKGGLMN